MKGVFKARHRNALGVEPKQPSFFFHRQRSLCFNFRTSLCVCVCDVDFKHWAGTLGFDSEIAGEVFVLNVVLSPNEETIVYSPPPPPPLAKRSILPRLC